MATHCSTWVWGRRNIFLHSISYLYSIKDVELYKKMGQGQEKMSPSELVGVEFSALFGVLDLGTGRLFPVVGYLPRG